MTKLSPTDGRGRLGFVARGGLSTNLKVPPLFVSLNVIVSGPARQRGRRRGRARRRWQRGLRRDGATDVPPVIGCPRFSSFLARRRQPGSAPADGAPTSARRCGCADLLREAGGPGTARCGRRGAAAGARLRSGANSAQGRVLATWSRVSHARRAVTIPQRTWCSVLTPCASESMRIGTPAWAAARAWHVVEVAAVGRRVDLNHRPGPRRRLEDAVDVDGVRLATLDLAAGQVPIASIHGRSIAATMRSVISGSPIEKDVCTEAMTQSSSASRSSS